MSKRQILMIIGAWAMIYLFLGFTPAWDKFFGLISGLLIIGIAYSFRPDVKEEKDLPFVEHRAEPKADNTVYPSGYDRKNIISEDNQQEL